MLETIKQWIVDQWSKWYIKAIVILIGLVIVSIIIMTGMGLSISGG